MVAHVVLACFSRDACGNEQNLRLSNGSNPFLSLEVNRKDQLGQNAGFFPLILPILKG